MSTPETSLTGHLSGPMAARAAQLQASFEQIRRKHRGLSGSRRQDELHEFLRDFLPNRLAISSGEIVASDGSTSPEMNTIVYDALDTPLLDRSPSSVVVPVEGVYAVIEVSSMLDTGKLAVDAEKIRAAKEMPKRAYPSGSEPFAPSYQFYGREYAYQPVLGFCFAYDSIDLVTLTEGVLDRLDATQEIALGVDMVCSLANLAKGCVLNATPIPTEGGSPLYDRLSAVPTPRTGRLLVKPAPSVDEPGVELMLFYVLLSHQLSQARTRPIRMLDYMLG